MSGTPCPFDAPTSKLSSLMFSRGGECGWSSIGVDWVVGWGKRPGGDELGEIVGGECEWECEVVVGGGSTCSRKEVFRGWGE